MRAAYRVDMVMLPHALDARGWRREQALIETEIFADLDAAHDWAWARVNENVCAEVYERTAAGWEPCDNWFW